MTLEELITAYRIPTTGVIHIGGAGEELAEYERLGFKRILFIQSDREKFGKLLEAVRFKPHALAVRCGIGEENGYSNSNEGLVPVRMLDTLLVEIGVHPKEFTVVEVARDVDAGTWARTLGATHLEAHVQIFRGALNRTAQINLWQQPHGRFANEIFQHFFARRLADKYWTTLHLHTAPWAGQSLFGLNDPLLEHCLPVVEEHDPRPEKSDLWIKHLRGGQPIGNVCLHGNFQFHTGLWDEEDRKTFRRLYQPVPALATALREALAKAMEGYKTLVAIHVRRGDYRPNHPGMFYATPAASYLKWLEEIWPLLDKPILYLASDDLNVLAEFRNFAPITRESLGVDIREQYYVDFWALTQAHALAISNSSFSMAAAMLNNKQPNIWTPNMDNEKGEAWVDIKTPMRPLRDGTLIPFDPWDDDVLLGRYDYQPSSEEVCHRLIVELLEKLDPQREGDVIEVGLGTGNWLFTELAPRKWRCHAVEPLPVPALEAAVQRYGVSLTRGALGSGSGAGFLSPGRSPDVNSLDPEWWGVDSTAEKVKIFILTLTAYLDRANITRVSCLKIDVEGAELAVISGMEERSPKPLVLMFEFGGTPKVEGKGGWTEYNRLGTVTCLKVLKALGYTTLLTVENGHEPVATKFADLNPDEWETLAAHGADYGNFIAAKE